jgi:uroporphyrinogen-III decarboxylase
MGSTPNDVIGLDWAVDISVARQTLGSNVKVQGNLDPMILFGPEEVSGSQHLECKVSGGRGAGGCSFCCGHANNVHMVNHHPKVRPVDDTRWRQDHSPSQLEI